jgi:hypothetical protein
VDWVKRIIKLNVCEILNGFGEILFSLVFMDQWNSQYDSLSPQDLAFTYNILKSLNVTLSICYLDTLCQEFYTLLTHWVVNFEITITVPVCCNTVEYDVTLFPVQHKKLWIRNNLLYLVCKNTKSPRLLFESPEIVKNSRQSFNELICMFYPLQYLQHAHLRVDCLLLLCS